MQQATLTLTECAIVAFTIRTITTDSGLSMSGFSIVILVFTASVLFYIISIYNKLASLKVRYKNAFACIEAQLKRRYELIPDMVEIARTHLNEAEGLLEEVIEARNSAVSCLKAATSSPGDAATINLLTSAEQTLNRAIARLHAEMESLPNMDANSTRRNLLQALQDTDKELNLSGEKFNCLMTRYNRYRQSFPAVLFAGLFGHAEDGVLLKMNESVKVEATSG